MSVGVFAPSQGGKSTFVGIIYQAMVRYTNEAEREFVFELSPRISTEVTTPIIEAMMRDRIFPPKTPPGEDFKSLEAILGFKPSREDLRLRGVKNTLNAISDAAQTHGLPLIRDPREARGAGYYVPAVLTIYDLAGEDIISFDYAEEEEFAEVFDCNSAIILIDASRFTTRAPDTEEYRKNVEQDIQLTEFYRKFLAYRVLKKKSHPIVHIVFTKVDAMEPKIINTLEKYTKRIDKKEKVYMALERMKQEERDMFGNALLRQFMQHFRAALLGGGLLGQEQPDMFFSWVELEEDPSGNKDKKTLKVTTPTGLNGEKLEQGRQNVYPYGNYKDLLRAIKTDLLYRLKKSDLEEIMGSMDKLEIYERLVNNVGRGE